jgi:DNA-binding transcriptional ArsR family regulator
MQVQPTPLTTLSDLEQLTNLFRLLSDKTRLNIVMLLAQGERNVSSLCSELQLPQPTVSHHLGLLRMNGIIGNRRAGKQVFYTLSARGGLPEGTILEFNTDGFAVRIETRPVA